MQSDKSKWKPGLLTLSLALLFLGVMVLLSALQTYRQLLTAEDMPPYLSAVWQPTAWKFFLAGGISFLGLGVLSALVTRFCTKAARHQREVDALRRKEEAMEAVNRQNQQLAHHQRLHILGTLTSSIAHEFNNLLTPIMGYSMMALEKIPPENEELYDDILEIYQASRKAKTIISRLSDLSRKNTDHSFRVVSPDDLIRKTLDVAAPAKPAQVEVRSNLNCWEQRIQANEIQISQLLLNLILNSYDAIGDQPGVVEIQTSFDETCVSITVTDSGCGIPEEVQVSIFEPFFTTKEAGKGTGLGLAIASQVVEDHNGTIHVESHAGEGTSFLVRLPRTPDHTSPG